jgi:haloacetate dehalogenase
MFEGFTTRDIETSGAKIHCRIGGKGRPVLLLHGYPQNHVMWHKVAPRLAERFTVVCADLRGYGESSKPAGGEGHAAYAKRAMAEDMAEVMSQLGFTRFSVVGHDRGARVTHRLALDHEGRVERVVVLDICPTATMYAATNQAFATAYYHWFFLIQPFDLPERLIGADPDFYLEKKIQAAGRVGTVFPEEALAHYKSCFRDPKMIHATCEDYRAAASIDLVHDAADAGKKVAAPLLALWGARGVVGKMFDPVADWRAKALDVRGHALDCGHFLAEEKPDETLAELRAFLD